MHSFCVRCQFRRGFVMLMSHEIILEGRSENLHNNFMAVHPMTLLCTRKGSNKGHKEALDMI